MPRIQIKRGTRSQLDTAASNSQLYQGEPYLITDSESMGVAVASNRYVETSSVFNIALGRSYYLVDSTSFEWNILCSMVDYSNAPGTGGGTIYVNYAFFNPFYTGVKFSITKVGIFVTAISGNANCDIGIYSTYLNQTYKGVPHPYQKLAEANIPTFNTTGLKSMDFNFTFYPNRLYWFAIKSRGVDFSVRTVENKKYLFVTYFGGSFTQLKYSGYEVGNLTSFPSTLNIGDLYISDARIPHIYGSRTSE